MYYLCYSLRATTNVQTYLLFLFVRRKSTDLYLYIQWILDFKYILLLIGKCIKYVRKWKSNTKKKSCFTLQIFLCVEIVAQNEGKTMWRVQQMGGWKSKEEETEKIRQRMSRSMKRWIRMKGEMKWEVEIKRGWRKRRNFENVFVLIKTFILISLNSSFLEACIKNMILNFKFSLDYASCTQCHPPMSCTSGMHI